MKTTFRTKCRCKAGNDMNCPYELPFEVFLTSLKRKGCVGLCDEVDAARAGSLMTQCSNCTGRGIFGRSGSPGGFASCEFRRLNSRTSDVLRRSAWHASSCG